MNRTVIIMMLGLLGILSPNGHSQSNLLHGLWLIEKVEVGGNVMTPVSRWTLINADGTYESGNGWLNHSYGTWTFNEDDSTFLPIVLNDVEDTFGPFNVEFSGEQMIFKRQEEGMGVKVTFTPITELPASTADKVKGLWGLKSVMHNGEEISNQIDPNRNKYLFLRWDRIYVENDAQGNRLTGYWHMNGHRPEVTLLSHNTGKQPETWRVSFSEKEELVMEGISDTNRGQIRSYVRQTQFPN